MFVYHNWTVILIEYPLLCDVIVLMTIQFGSKMVKINKKRIDFILETEKMRWIMTLSAVFTNSTSIIQEEETGAQSKDWRRCLESKKQILSCGSISRSAPVSQSVIAGGNCGEW